MKKLKILAEFLKKDFYAFANITVLKLELPPELPGEIKAKIRVRAWNLAKEKYGMRGKALAQGEKDLGYCFSVVKAVNRVYGSDRRCRRSIRFNKAGLTALNLLNDDKFFHKTFMRVAEFRDQAVLSVLESDVEFQERIASHWGSQSDVETAKAYLVYAKKWIAMQQQTN